MDTNQNITTKYRRVLLKVSGECLASEGNFGIDEAALSATAAEIAPLCEMGVQVGLVIGGGNFFRGRQVSESKKICRVTADTIGMLATTMNALAMRDCMESLGIKAKVFSTVTVGSAGEPYVIENAQVALDEGTVALLAGGTGHPYFTTDTCAALRAIELNADILVKATKVDGVYTADPAKDSNAQKIDTISYEDVIAQKLGVMDLTAVSLCMENKMPLLVLRLAEKGNILAAVKGEPIGTVVG